MESEIIDFENHKDKCRCCLRDFEDDDTQIKITRAVQTRFVEICQVIVIIYLTILKLPSNMLKFLIVA